MEAFLWVSRAVSTDWLPDCGCAWPAGGTGEDTPVAQEMCSPLLGGIQGGWAGTPGFPGLLLTAPLHKGIMVMPGP